MKRLFAGLLAALALVCATASAENSTTVTIDLRFGSQTYTDAVEVTWNGEAAEETPTPTPGKTETPTPAPEETETPAPEETETPETTPSDGQAVFYGTLKEGDSGPRVRELQEMLKKIFFYDGEITGVFDPETTEAVLAFQKEYGDSYGVQKNGIAGEQFYEALYRILLGGATREATEEESYGIVVKDDCVFYDSYKLKRSPIQRMTIGDVLRIKQIVYYGDEYWYYVEAEDGLYTRGYIQAEKIQMVTKEEYIEQYMRRIEGTYDLQEREVIGKIEVLKGHVVMLYTTQVVKDEARVIAKRIIGEATIEYVAYGNGWYQTKEGYYLRATDLTSGTVVNEANSYGRISKDNVYLRSSYSVNSNAKLGLAYGTLVRISRVVTSGNYRWYYVTVQSGGYTYNGYVREDMITLISEAEYMAGGGAGGAFGQEIIGQIRVTGNNVRLRYTPDGEVVGYANYGETYYYVDIRDGWYQTDSGYWIYQDYVEVISGVDPNATYRYDSTGSGVKWIQQVLTALKYYDREITGHYGRYTEEAVRGFQRDQGLTADGVCGPATTKKLQTVYNQYMANQSAGGGSNISGTAYNVDWFTYKEWYNRVVGLARGKTATLVDLRTGKTLQFKVQSTGNHADVEPLTAADTQTLLSIYGVTSLTGVWQARPMMVKCDGYQLVCSIYPEPHGADTVSGNNFDGQFCLHFNGSKTHGEAVLERHTEAIAEAVRILAAKGVTVLDTPN